MIWNYICVAMGGAIGSVLRYAVFRLIPQQNFPWATLGVNVIGSFCIGLVYAYLQNRVADDALRLFLIIGVVGGFTTFSAFSLETLTLLQNGNLSKAGLNITLSVVLCLITCFAGIFAGKGL